MLNEGYVVGSVTNAVSSEELGLELIAVSRIGGEREREKKV